MEVLGLKAIVCASLFTIGFTCVMFPRLLRRVPNEYKDSIVSLGQAGSGGVFLAAAMIDMFPDGLNDIYELVDENVTLACQITSTIFIAGFILIFFIEKIVFINWLEPQTGKEQAEDKSMKDISKEVPEKQPINTDHRFSVHCLHECPESDCNTVVPLSKRSIRRSNKIFSTKPSGHIVDVEDEPLDPYIVLEKTLTHVEGTREDRMKMALEVVEDTFSVRFSKMAEDNPFLYISLTVVLSVHTIIAGLAMGVCTENDCVLPIYIGVLSHIWVVALALGISLFNSAVSLKIHVLIAVFWASMPALGICSGSLVTLFVDGNILLAIQGFLVSLAAGTFIYVAIVDIIILEFTNQRLKYPKFVVFTFGFVLMGALLLSISYVTSHH